jgi:hypothetical protein
MRADILEEISEYVPPTIKEALMTIDVTDATMLLQAQVLNMTHQEIAQYHLYKASKTVQRKINLSLDIIKKITN